MTKAKLNLSDALSLPSNAVTQKVAFMGISGSGKTYGAGKFAEELLEIGAQVVIIDTIGNWFGLRLAADGKKKGIAIPILGGMQGDIPLEVQGGRLVAELIADSRSSMIVDVSDFTKGELTRFVPDFAVELLRLKRKSPSPLMIIWEECQSIVPQFVKGDVARMVGAVEALIKKGRNYGVGTTLISQRSAAVNKDVLSQIDTLFAFRTIGTHDRKAIGAWVTDQDIDVGKMFAELPKLPTGTCFCWSPQWLEVLSKITISKKWTFNSSATPEFGKLATAGALAPVELEKFKKTMAASIEKAESENPEKLKRRIVELERELKMKPAAPVKAPKVVVKSIIKDAEILRLEKIADKLKGAVDALSKIVGDAARDSVRRDAAPPPVARHTGLKITDTDRNTVLIERTYARRQNGSTHTAQLAGPESRILNAIAWFESIGIFSPLIEAVAFIAGYSPRGGAFNNPRSALRSKGLIEVMSGCMKLTDSGHALAEAPSRPLTTDEIHAAVLNRLGGPERRILTPLLEAYPEPLDNEELAARAGYDSKGGAYNNPRSKLRTLGLIEKVAPGQFQARKILFV